MAKTQHTSALLGVISLAGLLLVAATCWVTYGETTPVSGLLAVGGNLHPTVLHLPIGIFAYALFRTFVVPVFCRSRVLASEDLHDILGLVALTAFMAAALGLLLYMQGDYRSDQTALHMRWGVGFCLITLVQYAVVLCKPARMSLHRFLLLGGALALILAGHYGGLVTHGDPLAPLRPAKERLVEDPTPQALVVYEDAVAPIFADKCARCHAEDTKQKGDLRLDTFAAIMAGGENGEVLVPGSVADSLISELIHLPLDDDDRMPPEDKPQLTEEEIQIIDLWIEGGALQRHTHTQSG